MLSEEILTQPDAIEVHFCRPFEEMVRNSAIPMDDKTMKVLATLLLTSEKDAGPFLSKSVRYKIIENYFAMVVAVSVEDNRLMLFLAYLCSTPGECVMICTYLQYWAKTHGLKKLDLNIFCEQIFPWGFLKRSDLQVLWDGQKVDNGCNLLDQGQCSYSIFFM